MTIRPKTHSCECAAVKMRNRLVVPLLLAFAVPSFAEEFVPEKVVFPITDFKPDIEHLSPLSVRFGTGFCLDPDCRFVGTNYHVAKVMGKYVRVKGVFSVHRYLDSSQDEGGAEEVKLSTSLGASLKFNPVHDLAIYEMRRSLKGLHGIGFDAEDVEELKNSPAVDIYAYPIQRNPKRGLVCWHGTFIGTSPQGLLAFRYEKGLVRGGASGGIVVDSKTKKIVGILSQKSEGVDPVALAVPVKELADFVTRAQPYLQATLFPRTVFISPVAADLYPPYVWPRAEGLLQRYEEPLMVLHLRHAAQRLGDSLFNFTATQTFSWGHDNREPDAGDAYETLIVDGKQRWRRPDSAKLYDMVPFPPLNGWILPGGEWSWLPQMVGMALGLKIRQAPDAIVSGRTIHVFQYAANVEDGVCPFAYIQNFVLLQRIKSKFYGCHGEVWMDRRGDILRISEAIDLTGPAYHYWVVITYGWMEKDGTKYLVPVTIASQLEHKKTYWCRGLFTDYVMFSAKARVVSPPELEQVQQNTANP